MPPLHYSAIIRTNRCDALLEEVVAALNGQTMPPCEILLVDSSHDPQVSRRLAALGSVIPYPDEPFNYSKAINIGVAAAREKQVLLVSSHLKLESVDIIAFGVEEALSRGLEILYWIPPIALGEDRDMHVPITRRTFTGRNGLSNACAMFPRALALARPFREEVFSAEDQEWAHAYFERNRQAVILRVVHHGVAYLNPHHGVGAINVRKVANEEVAIAYYVRRRLLLPDRVISLLLRAVVARLRGRKDRAALHAGIGMGLLKAYFRRPGRDSRYV